MPDKKEWLYDVASRDNLQLLILEQRHSLLDLVNQLDEYDKNEELCETDDSDYLDFEDGQESDYSEKRVRKGILKYGVYLHRNNLH